MAQLSGHVYQLKWNPPLGALFAWIGETPSFTQLLYVLVHADDEDRVARLKQNMSYGLALALLNGVQVTANFSGSEILSLTVGPLPVINVVNMIPATLSGESWQDSEPNVTVNPANPLQIVGTAFTPDPAGGPDAPVYVSNDGGLSWTLNPVVPGGNSSTGTGDITVRFSQNALYAAYLRGDTSLTMNVAQTPDASGGAPMIAVEGRSHVDQPFVETLTDAGKDRVFVGNNDFAATSGNTGTVDVATDALGTGLFTQNRVDVRPTVPLYPNNPGFPPMDLPSVRPAVHPDGTVYAAFLGIRGNTPTQLVDVVVVRDDAWAAGVNPFRALLDPGDDLAGVIVAHKVAIGWMNYLGWQRTGSNITIAVDPRNSSTVYLAWCDGPGPQYTVHVRRSTNRGQSWSADLLTVVGATNPALAVNLAGKLGLVYQQLAMVNGAQRWETHFRSTLDAALWDDRVLATTPATTPAPVYDPYLGDYIYLTTVGLTFCGVFCANNTPDPANFPSSVRYQRKADFAGQRLLALDGTEVAPSIDPFFFRVS